MEEEFSDWADMSTHILPIPLSSVCDSWVVIQFFFCAFMPFFNLLDVLSSSGKRCCLRPGQVAGCKSAVHQGIQLAHGNIFCHSDSSVLVRLPF